MFTDIEKTLTRDDIRKCIAYSNPSSNVENEEEQMAHWKLRNAYVEYIEAWNIFKNFEGDDNRKIMMEKKEKVRQLVETYKDILADGNVLLAMKAAYLDVENRK